MRVPLLPCTPSLQSYAPLSVFSCHLSTNWKSTKSKNALQKQSSNTLLNAHFDFGQKKSRRNAFCIWTINQCFSTKAPKAQEKSYLFFSLFFLISSLEKSRGRVREKWRVKREEWKVQKEKAAFATFLFIIAHFQLKINTFRPKGEKLPLLFSLLSYLFSGKVAREKLEKSEEWKEKSEEYKKKKPLSRLFFLVEMGGVEFLNFAIWLYHIFN